MIPILDFATGKYTDLPPQSLRTLADLAPIFAVPHAIDEMDRNTVVYEIHGSPAEVEGPARLLYATTVLHPGRVGNEYFMTRGHFHTDTSRGEFMVTLQGEGALVLMDRDRKTWLEPMSIGSTHDIDGRFAHRVVNTGATPLVFLVVWMSDCGHDYESIKDKGFGARLFAGDNGPELAPQD